MQRAVARRRFARPVAKAAQAGQFVRVLPWEKGELIPLTLADWDAKAGTICLVVQAMGASSIAINQMKVGDSFTGIAGPLGKPSDLHRYEGQQLSLIHISEPTRLGMISY